MEEYVSSRGDRRGGHSPKVKREFEKNPKGIAVNILEVKPIGSEPGSFNTLAIAWVVNPLRKDKRTGAEFLQPLSSYAKDLYQSITLGMKVPRIQPCNPDGTYPKPEPVKRPKKNIYQLQYTAQEGYKHHHGMFRKIAAGNDAIAAEVARCILLDLDIPQEWRDGAQLFLDEREVPIWKNHNDGVDQDE